MLCVERVSGDTAGTCDRCYTATQRWCRLAFTGRGQVGVVLRRGLTSWTSSLARLIANYFHVRPVFDSALSRLHPGMTLSMARNERKQYRNGLGGFPTRAKRPPRAKR